MPFLSASLHHSQAPIPSSSLCSSLDFFPPCPSIAYTRKLRIGLSISCVTSLVLRRGKGSQSQPPGNVMLFLTQPWRGCLPSLSPGHVAGSLSIWNTRAFSTKLLPSQSAVVFLQVTYCHPSECQHKHVVHQPFPSVLYHLQSCWRCTLSCGPGCQGR